MEYQSVPQPIRLPGQYFDEESGLHYNRYRYYDPYSARYFSQDPIGLAGGENAYSYVSNPLTWIDPLGLHGCPVSVNRAIYELNNGAEKVFVKSRRDAEELFMKRYSGEDYFNMTGESGTTTKNLLKYRRNTDGDTKLGTYHWDDIKDKDGRVAGHSPLNPDGDLPHLQIHEFDGKTIHIFFPWNS